MGSKNDEPRLYEAKVSRVPYSSVVGQIVTITIDGAGVVAQLGIMVPQPRLDYRAVTDAVVDALMRGGGRMTLVLRPSALEPTDVK